MLSLSLEKLVTFRSCQTQLGLEGTAEARSGLDPVGPAPAWSLGLFPAASASVGGAAGLRAFAGATLCLQRFKPFSPFRQSSDGGAADDAMAPKDEGVRPSSAAGEDELKPRRSGPPD